MPKELIHFTIAELTARRLTKTAFGPCLKAAADAMLLGSVAHDALFYAVTPGGKPLEKLSHKLHGADGQDTHTLIRMQTELAASSDEKNLPAAVLVGLASHLCADIVMHPMVWHFTGNYYGDDPVERSKSRQRHRAMESLMDMVACRNMIGRARYSLRRMLRRTPDLLETGLPVARLAEMASMHTEAAKAQLGTAWSIFAMFQAAFTVRPLSSVLYAARPWLPRSMAEITTLFYAPQLMKQAPMLSGLINYAHPVTGDTMQHSLQDLMNTAADRASDLCGRLENTVFHGAPLELPETGPSLDSGMNGVPTTAMHHFAAPPFPRLT